jgi:hypothetical protein
MHVTEEPEREKLIGEWRKLHNEKLHNLYCISRQCDWGKQIKKAEMGAACRTYGENKNVYRVLARKPEGKRSLERPRLRW